MNNKFLETLEKRRTIYNLSNESTVSDDRLQEIINYSVKHTPTAFNSQSDRVIVLLNDKHDKLWDITEDALREVVPEDNFQSTKEKIQSFKDGYGTLVFFQDMSVVKSLQNDFELYKDNFPIWSNQSNGMLQHVIWTALAEEGLGASLQHYNELIEEDVKEEFSIPKEWKITAQMPFGKPNEEPEEKEFVDVEKRVKVYR